MNESMRESRGIPHCLTYDKETVEAYHFALGKVIASIHLEQRPACERDETADLDYIRVTFTDATQIYLYDDEQACCETRYITTDDALGDFVGATLVGMAIKEAPPLEDGENSHEIQFLELLTSRGPLTFATHNEHNGFYGGFTLAMRKEAPLGI